MWFFSKIDIISPPITLYYKDEPLHPSIFSGILSIICYILMVCFGFYYLIAYFQKKNPTSFFFNRYVEDVGYFPLNSSSIFGFFQFINTQKNDFVDIDFDSVRFIGIEKSIDTYISNSDLTNYDHWIYGKCNNDTDIEGINYLINFNDYFRSACIRKYYNKNDGKYYETTDDNFRWPALVHGSSNSEMIYYGIIVEKCKNDSLRVNLEKKYCKSDFEINEYMSHIIIQLQLIDHFADVFNYNEPFTKYLYKINSALFSETYSINHLNFNPAIIRTHKGILLEKVEEKHAYFFDQNEKITATTGNTGIYISFYFWMQNTMQYYERTYELLQDALSNVGGITRLILSVASIVNYIFSRYVILIDSDELFIEQNGKKLKERAEKKNVIEKQISKDVSNPNPPRKFNLYKNYRYQYQYQNNSVLSNSLSKENVNNSRLSREGTDILYNNRQDKEKNGKKVQNKYLVYNKNNYFNGNNYIYYERKQGNKIKVNEEMNPIYHKNDSNLKNDIDSCNKYINEKDDVNNKIDLSNKSNKNEYTFCRFLSYIICCGRNNQKMNYAEELRYKILSEETVFQNYLNLIEMNKLSEFIK